MGMHWLTEPLECDESLGYMFADARVTKFVLLSYAFVSELEQMLGFVFVSRASRI